MNASELVEIVRKNLKSRSKYRRPEFRMIQGEPTNYPKKWGKKAVSRMEDIQASLEANIPPDFNYSLTIDKDDVFLSIIFDDGEEISTIVPLPPEIDLDHLEQLRNLDWDAIRIEMFRKGKILEIVARLDWSPSSESPTALLRSRHHEFVERFKVDPRIQSENFAILAAYETFMCFGESAGFERRIFKSENHLVGDICDMLATSRFVLCVKIHGKWLSDTEVDEFCSKAKSRLGPLSRFNAETRYVNLLGEF